MEGLAQVFPFLLLALAFWFLLIRPQRKRQMELMSTQNAVEIGSEVMLGSGIFGRVTAETDEHLSLEVAPGVVIKVARAAVVRVVASEDDTRPDDRDGTQHPHDQPGDEAL